MSLQAKTLLVVASVVIVATVSLYLASHFTLLHGYEKIEAEDTRANVLRTVSSFDDQSRRITLVARGYAFWDEMYDLVQAPNPEFINSLGLTPDLYASHQVNLIAILDVNYNPVFLKLYDLERLEPLDVPPDLPAYLQPGSPLLGHTPNSAEKTGVILLGGRPMVVASLGALHTDFSGDPRGAVVMGRFLDNRVIASLAEAMKFPVAAYLLDDPQNPADVAGAIAELGAAVEAQPVVVKRFDADTIAGYTFIKTVTGRPAFVFKISLPRTIYSQGLTSFRYFAALAAVAGLSFILVSMLLLRRFVLSPLTGLSQQISLIRAGGDHSQRVDVRGKDELAALGLTINDMLAVLEKYSGQYLQAVFDSVNDAVFIHDAAGNILDTNTTACRMYGYSREEIRRLDIGALSADGPLNSQADALARLEKARQGEAQLFEWQAKSSSGRIFWTEVNARFTLVGDEGRFFITIRDITERKQTEVEREKLITDLEAKNAELERFAYTVSHDLKSPLVTIGNFLGFLKKDALGGRRERLEADINRIREATEQMQRLLDELLELSRIGRLMNPPQHVSFATIVAEALTLAQGRLAACGAAVEVAPDLPVVYGDRFRLVEVVQNLVDNAAKYRGDQPRPSIQIGWREQDGQAVFFVKDNGLGIDPRYHQKVFGLFEKLDASSDGTGIGLALVKRIVEVHGGLIWIESEGRGRGTTVCFTLGGSPGA